MYIRQLTGQICLLALFLCCVSVVRSDCMFDNCVCVFFQTFDECVAAGGSDCAPEKLWLQIPFFCGHYSECWSVWACVRVCVCGAQW